jgi:nucleoside-diphosphate-sugar epimerase
MKILITGVSGYLGNELCREAAKRGYIVHALVRQLDASLIQHPSVMYFIGDITDKVSITDAMRGCEFVIHSAGITKFAAKDNSIFYKVNVTGTRNLLECALQLSVKRFVFTSSGATIGPSFNHPMTEDDQRLTAFENDYELSKFMAEKLVKDFSKIGLHTVIVCAPRIFGPGKNCNGNTICPLIGNILRYRVAFIPSKKQIVANYGFINDITNGHFLALEHGAAGERYILGGENISYERFFKTIRSLAPKKIYIITVPDFLLMTWARLHALIFRIRMKETHVSPSVIRRILKNRALSCEKAVLKLNYSITPFEEGMKRTIHFITAHYDK